MLDPRLDTLLNQIEALLEDYHAMRRDPAGDGEYRLQMLSNQVEMLQVENARLRLRQEEVCGRLERLLQELDQVQDDKK